VFKKGQKVVDRRKRRDVKIVGNSRGNIKVGGGGEGAASWCSLEQISTAAHGRDTPEQISIS